MGDRRLHHLSRLQHKRQDQFAGPELIANFFHGRQHDVVENMHGIFMHSGEFVAFDQLVNICVHAVFVAVQDAPMQAFFSGHALSGVVIFLPRQRPLDVLVEFDHALQSIRAPIEN